MNAARPLITRVLKLGIVFSLLCSLVMGVYYGPHSAVSSLVGSVLAAANFALLAQLVAALLDEGNRTKSRAALFLSIKFIALVTIIGLLIRYEIVRGGALMAGVSALVAAIVVVGLFQPPDVDPTSASSGTSGATPTTESIDDSNGREPS
jgi:hypothetical protein